VSSSEEYALGLHRKYGSSDRLIRHCWAVAFATRVLGEELEKRGRKMDVGAAVLGAELHDIGRNKVQTVWHGVEGASILGEEGLPGQIVEIVRRHVGAGISPEEAKSLGLPDIDLIPRTIEERVVCFADKMVDGDVVRPFEEEVRRYERKGHDVKRLLDLRDSLKEDLGEDPEGFLMKKVNESHAKARA
jgi:uncharacterized protein